MAGSNPSPDLTTPASTVAQGQEVTDRKRAEEALRESDERYRSLATCSMDAVLLTAPDGRILAANEAACRMFDRSEQELIQVGCSGIIDGSDSPLAPALEERGRTGQYRGELTWMRKDGTKFRGEFSSATFTDRHGNLRMSMTIRDITERKHVEEALRESEARHRGLFENSLMGISATDPKGRLIQANPAYARMYGYEGPKEMMAEVANVRRLYANTKDRIDEVRTLEKNGVMEPREVELVRRDGARFYALLGAREVKNAGGEVLGYQAVHIDITDRKQAEKRMQMFSQELLAARENERRRVASILHHDVGSLAVGMSAHLDAIEQDIRHWKLDEALGLMKRTRKLFDETMARLKGLATQLRPPELDLLGLRAALRQHFSQVAEYGHTQIHFKEALGRRRVAGDPATILFRVAQEALTNAITHGEAKRVDVSLRALKKEIRLTVRDNGTGFDPSEERVGKTSQIGLRVMKEMVIYAGGVCLIDSTPGKGTTVRVSLPLKTAALGPGDVTAPMETVEQGPRPEEGSSP